MAEQTSSWLDATHPYYRAMASEWSQVMTHYRAALNELRTSTYLKQRAQGEPDEQFRERRDLADYTPLFALVADSYVGRISTAEEQTDRAWGELGNVTDPTTVAGRLWDNADGDGTNYLTVLEDAAGLSVVQQEFWCLVEGVRRDESGDVIGEASMRLIEPVAVPAWGGSVEKGTLWVKVKHTRVDWENYRELPKEKTLYRIYTLGGYQDWEKDEDGKERAAGPFQRYGGTEQDPFYFYRSAEAAARSRPSERILPLFRVRLPMRRFVGSVLAGKNGVIFNMESERDNLLRIANTPKGVFVGDYNQFAELLESIRMKTGGASNLWQLDPQAREKHYFMAPPVESATIATEVLKEKRETFFLSAFRFYEDAVRGRQKTATQIDQEAAAGEHSFLSTLATALDELENGIGLRLEQISMPDEPSKWGKFHVKRPRDFKPLDAEAEKDRIMKRYFGMDPLPADEDTVFEMARWVVEADGGQLDEEREAKLRQAVRTYLDRRDQGSDVENLFNLPPAA